MTTTSGRRSAQTRTEGDWVNRNRRYWEANALRYDKLYQNRWSHQEDRAVAYQLRDSDIAPGGNLLDLGCGTGLAVELLTSAGISVSYVGLDISAASLAECTRKHSVRTVSGDMSEPLPFPSASQDAVIALYTSLSYSADWTNTLAEVARVLKPGGRTYLSVLSRWSLRRLIQLRFGRVELYRTRQDGDCHDRVPAWAIGGGEFRSALAEHGFTDIRRYPLGFFSGLAELPNLWAVDRRLARAFPGLAHTTDWVATRRQSR